PADSGPDAAPDDGEPPPGEPGEPPGEPGEPVPGDQVADRPPADKAPPGQESVSAATSDPAAPGSEPRGGHPEGPALSAPGSPAGPAAKADPAPRTAGAEMPAPETPPAQPPTAQPDTVPAADLLRALTALTAIGSRVDDVAAAAAELARLRSRDTDLIARLHDDVTRLRSGEVAAALNPVVTGMIKLRDQMVSLGALDDPASPVGMLHTQLLQVMELTCAVKPFTPSAGERFDASRHTGTRRKPTADPAADGTVASTIKAGFVRADGSVVRVAEVEVHRLSG
ncbi:MAG TPA: hypothetical protein VEM58_07400, partial [Streptosporangiaceae bacterium]|nr:hypothetical protein [Streptosporangiaceae bacterium]